MSVTSIAARLMVMDDATWARHANPWSFWTRFSALPLLTLAIWSRVWIGHYAWGAAVLAILWIWLNPRAFAPPQSTDSWPARAVMGERVYLNRKVIPVPQEFVRFASVLNVIIGLGALVLGYGLWALDLKLVLAGMVVSMLAKTWFVDRMAMLFDLMQDASAEYQNWRR
ncbi:MAG: DUF6653 family protein [Paracoccaceae bacterium]